MKLKELLETLPSRRILYVGARSAFLLGGNKAMLMKQIPALDEKLKKRAEAKRETYKSEYRRLKHELGAEHRRTKAAERKFLNAEDPVPLLERIVIDTYERTTEIATNIIVVGDETGNVWSVHEGKPFEVNYNIEMLTGAILRDVVQDLKFSFRAELKELQECLTRLEKYRKDSAQLENYLRSDDVKVFTACDPEYLIKKTREIVGETLAEGARRKIQGGNHEKGKNRRDGRSDSAGEESLGL